jgi:hypothetical protein
MQVLVDVALPLFHAVGVEAADPNFPTLTFPNGAPPQDGSAQLAFVMLDPSLGTFPGGWLQRFIYFRGGPAQAGVPVIPPAGGSVVYFLPPGWSML